MDKQQVLMVRVYVTERRAKIELLMKCLAESRTVRGITVLEAVSGIGTTPMIEGTTISIEGHPVILEFFDQKERAMATLARVRELVAPRHVVVHPVTLME